MDLPEINLELNFIKYYYENNDVAQRDMDLIIKELIESEVVSD